jgi:hypothetical protein
MEDHRNHILSSLFGPDFPVPLCSRRLFSPFSCGFSHFLGAHIAVTLSHFLLICASGLQRKKNRMPFTKISIVFVPRFYWEELPFPTDQSPLVEFADSTLLGLCSKPQQASTLSF